MQSDKNSPWSQGLTTNLVSNGIAGIVGLTVTYLTHEGSGWIKPILFGGAAWLITFCSILAYRISRSLPPRVKPIDAKNVHLQIRDWLDRFNMTVQTISASESEFVFVVTTVGGKKISITRGGSSWGDYMVLRGLVTAGEQEKKAFALLTEDELKATRLAIQLELSRAVMGYKSEKDVLDEITVFKNIPITPTLTEEDLFGAIWKVEAML